MSQQSQIPERPVVRVPLTTGQHILHLILFIVTFGLWTPVWIWRAIGGNKIWADVPNPRYGYWPPAPPPPPYGQPWQGGPR